VVVEETIEGGETDCATGVRAVAGDGDWLLRSCPPVLAKQQPKKIQSINPIAHLPSLLSGQQENHSILFLQRMVEKEDEEPRGGAGLFSSSQ
jgi:hypothetical protein